MWLGAFWVVEFQASLHRGVVLYIANRVAARSPRTVSYGLIYIGKHKEKAQGEEKKMTFLKKAVFGALVMLLVGSGVAQAQDCRARTTSPVKVRAEGITEIVADITVQCTGGVLGLTADEEADIVFDFNTNITNKTSPTSEVMNAIGVDVVDSKLEATEGTPKANGGIVTRVVMEGSANITNDQFTGEDAVTLSEDGTSLTWELTATQAGLAGPVDDGFTFRVSGIRANASRRGDGEDVTVTISVGGQRVNANPITVADVMTGLETEIKKKSKAASGTDCVASEFDLEVTDVTIKEGFNTGIVHGDALLVQFSGIPEGVMVTVPIIDIPFPTGKGASRNKTGGMLMLRQGSGADKDGLVELSASGRGEVVFDVGTKVPTDDDPSAMVETGMESKETIDLTLTFEWSAGDDAPTIGAGTVSISFNPVSSRSGHTFSGSPVPRFVANDNSLTAITIKSCDPGTTLMFTFLTNQDGFDSGLVITNFSKKSGSCEITYYDSDGDMTDTDDTEMISPMGQEIWLLSMAQKGFQGSAKAVCDFTGGEGFAFVSNGYGSPAGPTLAQGYLAIKE